MRIEQAITKHLKLNNTTNRNVWSLDLNMYLIFKDMNWELDGLIKSLLEPRLTDVVGPIIEKHQGKLLDEEARYKIECEARHKVYHILEDFRERGIICKRLTSAQLDEATELTAKLIHQFTGE